MLVRLLVLLVSAFLVTACADPEKERLRETTRPSYDDRTGRLKELTYDANGNGRIDTWTEMDGARPVRARIDRDEDGTLDRWEYYDEQGLLRKVGFSRSNDGKPDAWAYPGPDGAIGRVEVSSIGDENRIDRWEQHAPGGTPDRPGQLLSAAEDSTGDGRPDKWETYEGGVLRTVEFDHDGDGKPERRLTYEQGELVTIETRPDGAGGYLRRERVSR